MCNQRYIDDLIRLDQKGSEDPKDSIGNISFRFKLLDLPLLLFSNTCGCFPSVLSKMFASQLLSEEGYRLVFI